MKVLSKEQLADLLQSNPDPKDVLLIDSRPFSAYALSHIRGAINVRLSNILIRRLSQGKISVEDLLCDEHKALFRALADNALIVVYDEKPGNIAAYDPSQLDVKVPLQLIISALCSAGRQTASLSAGFEAFAAEYGHLVESLEISAPPPQLAALRNLAPAHDSPSKIRVTDLEPTQILPFLYIGARKDAVNFETLKNLGITHIVNVTRDCPNAFEKDGEIKYRKIPVDDHWSQDLSSYFDAAFEFIDAARNRNNDRVLVHCMAGVSRSPAITIAYIMRAEGMTLNAAYNFVKSKRPAISPHLDFLGELVEYEKRFVKSAPTAAEAEEAAQKFANSSLLYDTCPWLRKICADSPDTAAAAAAAAAAASVPATPRHSTLSHPAPWVADFAKELPETSKAAALAAPTAVAPAKDEQTMPVIVLAPVPRSKSLKRALSANAIPSPLC